jgi:hypothetical protein
MVYSSKIKVEQQNSSDSPMAEPELHRCPLKWRFFQDTHENFDFK